MNFVELLVSADCNSIVGLTAEFYEEANQSFSRRSGYPLYPLQSSYLLQSSYQLKKHYKQREGGFVQRQVAHPLPERTGPSQAGLSGLRSNSLPLRERRLSRPGRRSVRSRGWERATWRQATHDRTPTMSRSQFGRTAAIAVDRPDSPTGGPAMSSVRSSSSDDSQAGESHVVHGVWRCEECDASRVCPDAADCAEQHAAETGHETSAESTVFATFHGDRDAELMGGRP